MKNTKSLIVVILGLCFLAFTRPEINDVVELSSWLSGRSTAYFRKIDQNRIKSLPPGTRGLVQKIKYFPRTRNYGLCLDLENSNSNKCIWVYYNKRNPRMTLSQDNTPTTQIEKADSAETTEKITGVQAAPEIDPVADIIPSETDSSDENETDNDQGMDAAQTAIENLDSLNQEAKRALNPEPTCENCAPKLSNYARCNKMNNYQETEVSAMLNSSKYASIYQGPQKEIVRTSCIQRVMETAPLSLNYKHCKSGDIQPRSGEARACNSQNNVELTAKSFNAVANCLGDYVSGSETTKAEAGLMIFALTAHESGLHNNSVSQTGAGGIGQMTGSAIKAVNLQLESLKAHLRASSNPQCSGALLKALDTPMQASKSKSCDRLAISKDNPLKNIIYTFALQALTRKYVDDQVEGRTFRSILSNDLSDLEKERLLSSLGAWSHNTGSGGMAVPLRVLLAKYLKAGKKIASAKDVDQFLADLAPVMRSHPHKDNRRRGGETSAFYKAITKRMAQITSEPHSCLAK